MSGTVGLTPRIVGPQRVTVTCDGCDWTTASTGAGAGGLGNAAQHAKANPGHIVRCHVERDIAYGSEGTTLTADIVAGVEA